LFHTEKTGNTSCAGSDDLPPSGKCVCGVAYSMKCVLVSCSIYVICFVISSFSTSVVRVFFAQQSFLKVSPQSEIKRC